MSRTKAWQKKMDQLTEKERSLRKELEFKSGKLEKRSLVVLGIAGAITLGLIGAYSFRPKKKKIVFNNQEEGKVKIVESSPNRGWKIGSFITEKAIVAIITLLINKFQKEALSDDNIKK